MLASRAAIKDRRAIHLTLIGALLALLAVAAINLFGTRSFGVATSTGANAQRDVSHTVSRPDSGTTSAGQTQTRSTVGNLTPVRSTDQVIVLGGGAVAGAKVATPQDPICPNNEPCGP
jgi:hypothetical protein